MTTGEGSILHTMVFEDGLVKEMEAYLDTLVGGGDGCDFNGVDFGRRVTGKGFLREELNKEKKSEGT